MKELFKIRASQGSKITTGQMGLTAKQTEELDLLTKKEKRTEKQTEKMHQLEYKRDNPELPQTLKTYCEGWLRGKIYQRNKQVFSKYFDKGNVMEDSSIEATAEYLKLGMVFKNEDFFEDDFFIGTPDVLLSDEVIDMKNPWDFSTFPLFEGSIPNMDYYWQLQIYMHLTGRKKARLIYYLSDTPDNLIEREAWSHCRKLGMDELDEEIYDAYIAKMTYDDVPPEYRIKIFEIEYSEKDIAFLKERVMHCRTYIKTLIDDFNIK